MKKSSLWKAVCVVCLFYAAMAINSSAQTLTTLALFDYTNGSSPAASLIQARDGNLYGTTKYGGPVSGCEGGFNPCGTVFKITPSGTLTTLHTFVYSDGAFPVSPVVQGSDGNFYGTNVGEGDSGGSGAIFKMTPSGTLTVLKSTASPAGLVQGHDGNFYGTTPRGYTDGTVFKITPGGTLTTLHTFGGTDGNNPMAALILATDGNFYGTTANGGTSSNCGYGCGTIFKMTPSGSLTSLHSFSVADGFNVVAGLVQGADGNFYGVATSGGAQNAGVAFKITPSGTFTLLHTFNNTDGYNPEAALIQATDGNFYGTTAAGGANGQGTVFAMTPSGSVTTLYSFCPQSGCADGANPIGGVIQASDGKFYGTTTGGGSNNSGTVFRLDTNSATLTVSVVGAGTVTSTDGYINCPGNCSHIYPHGTAVVLNASAAGGWTFTGWSGACTGTSSCDLTMTHNQSVTATFTQNTYMLTVSTSGNGSVTSTDGFINCPGTCSHIYLSNTHVTLNANPALGWGLSAWSGACSGTGSCVVDMTQSLSVGATFIQLHFTLTVSAIGNGSVTSTDGFISCPGTCSHTYLSLTQVTLDATPGQGWFFGGWNGGCSGTSSCTVSMTQTFTIDAIFSEALQFVAVAPCRLVDTRNPNGPFGGPPIQGKTARSFPIPQQTPCDIPATAAAYSLNVTLVPPPGGIVGLLTIWPTGEAQPIISTMNSWDGRFKANAAIVPAGTQGAVSVYVSSTANVVLDIDGYFEPVSSSTLAFYPLAPCRVADTRWVTGDLGGPYLTAKHERTLPVLQSRCGIPDTAQAYSFNFTAIPRGGPVWVFSAWPDGLSQPATSTLNAPTGTVVANAAIVPAGTNGAIDVWVSNDSDLAIDVNGYFAPPGAGGLSLYSMAPCRALDTRKVGSGQPFTGPHSALGCRHQRL